MELEWTEVEEVTCVRAVTEEPETHQCHGWACGVLVIHQSVFLYDWEQGYGRYNITHIPSGTCMPLTFPDVETAKRAVSEWYAVLPANDPRWQITFDHIVNMQEEWEAIGKLLTPTTQQIHHWLYKYEHPQPVFEMIGAYTPPLLTTHGDLPTTTPA